MQHSQLCRLLPTFEILAEAFPEGKAYIRDSGCTYRSLQLYQGQEDLDGSVLYLIKLEDRNDFPLEDISYICTEEVPGGANHLICPGMREAEILNRLMELFSVLREQEIILDQLAYHDAGLEALCEAGAQMLGNPVYLHDDWFIALATSSQVVDEMRPEQIMSSTSGFVPKAIVDDFKFDNEYLETYSHHTPQIWQGTAQAPRSLYVNLWEGEIYRGRLLVCELNRSLQKRDFLLAELLAQHAMMLIRKRRPTGEYNHSMDDLVYQILQGKPLDSSDLNQMLRSLGWNMGDQYCVIRVQGQQRISSAMDHLLHSDLFRIFPHCYILLGGNQQCLILNVTRQMESLASIRHALSPICRDYCLYAGISSPTEGIQQLHIAYNQAGFALDCAFQLRNERWIIPFSECALDYLFTHPCGEFETNQLISPELHYLLQYDRENDTEYFPTLREYLLQERNIPRTSEKLIIHRTTLLYRLKKIQSLVSLDLEDPKIRLYLLISLYILGMNQN